MRTNNRGFTLIEVMVVMTLLAMMAAVAVPNMVGIAGKGRDSAIKEDRRRIDQAVDSFASDFHAGPNSTPRWGAGSKGRWYPTRTGLPGLLELSTNLYDPKNFKNPRVDKFAPGPTTAGAASGADISSGIIWIGLLTKPAQGSAGEENETTGGAHPLAGEIGGYLKDIPESASEANADVDFTANSSGPGTGFYTWVLLSTRQTVPAYSVSGIWYAATGESAEFGGP